MTYLNIHTHLSTDSDTWAIKNVLEDFDTIPTDGYYSAGLHPWYLQQEYLDKQLDQLDQALYASNVLAVGECGLDKVCKTDKQLQVACFRQQIRMANRHHKPLLLHCVKAYDDVLRLLQEEQSMVPAIFHGYQKGLQLAEQLIAAGYYLSFGKHLFNPATASVFQKIPLNQVFLETDAADLDIATVYQIAAREKKISADMLVDQLMKNATRVFGLQVE